MPMTMCSKCMYCFDPNPQAIESLDMPKIGTCRRHSPRNIVFMPDSSTRTLWPMVKIFHDGCGEGEVGLVSAPTK